MTDQQTIIKGTRTITHDPLGADGERERGTIDNTDFTDETWLGDNVQQVIEAMENDLGAVGEAQYTIRE